MSGERVGEQVTPLERTIELPDMIAYAGATWDWHRIHYDESFLAARKLPAPVVDGQVFGALMVAALQDHFGPDATVSRLSFRFKNAVFANERVRVSAEIVSSEDRAVFEVALSVDVVGASPRPATSDARATVFTKR